MIDDMGIFRTTLSISSLTDTDRRRQLENVMVDSGSEYNWIPREILDDLGINVVRTQRFETADRRILDREIGFAMLYAAGRATPTIVVFAEPDDMVLLGIFGLEGLNVRIDLARKELVPAGPLPVAAAAQPTGNSRTPFQQRPRRRSAGRHSNPLVAQRPRLAALASSTAARRRSTCLTLGG